MGSVTRTRAGWLSLLHLIAPLMFAAMPASAIAQETDAALQRSLVTAEYRDEVVAAINARNRLFEQNILAGDSQKLIDDYFVPDEWEPMVLGPNQPPVRGRAAILEDFSRMGAGLSLLRIESLEVQVGHDMASEIGRVHLTGNNGVTRVGRYTVLWLKTDNGWLAKMDFFRPTHGRIDPPSDRSVPGGKSTGDHFIAGNAGLE